MLFCTTPPELHETWKVARTFSNRRVSLTAALSPGSGQVPVAFNHSVRIVMKVQHHMVDLVIWLERLAGGTAPPDWMLVRLGCLLLSEMDLEPHTDTTLAICAVAHAFETSCAGEQVPAGGRSSAGLWLPQSTLRLLCQHPTYAGSFLVPDSPDQVNTWSRDWKAFVAALCP